MSWWTSCLLLLLVLACDASAAIRGPNKHQHQQQPLPVVPPTDTTRFVSNIFDVSAQDGGGETTSRADAPTDLVVDNDEPPDVWSVTRPPAATTNDDSESLHNNSSNTTTTTTTDDATTTMPPSSDNIFGSAGSNESSLATFASEEEHANGTTITGPTTPLEYTASIGPSMMYYYNNGTFSSWTGTHHQEQSNITTMLDDDDDDDGILLNFTQCLLHMSHADLNQDEFMDYFEYAVFVLWWNETLLESHTNNTDASPVYLVEEPPEYVALVDDLGQTLDGLIQLQQTADKDGHTNDSTGTNATELPNEQQQQQQQQQQQVLQGIRIHGYEQILQDSGDSGNGNFLLQVCGATQQAMEAFWRHREAYAQAVQEHQAAAAQAAEETEQDNNNNNNNNNNNSTIGDGFTPYQYNVSELEMIIVYGSFVVQSDHRIINEIVDNTTLHDDRLLYNHTNANNSTTKDGNTTNATTTTSELNVVRPTVNVTSNTGNVGTTQTVPQDLKDAFVIFLDEDLVQHINISAIQNTVTQSQERASGTRYLRGRQPRSLQENDKKEEEKEEEEEEEEEAHVLYDPQSPLLYAMEEIACPLSSATGGNKSKAVVAKNVTCHAVFGSFRFFTIGLEPLQFYNYFTAATREAIDKGDLQGALNRTHPDSIYNVLGAYDELLPPMETPTVPPELAFGAGDGSGNVGSDGDSDPKSREGEDVASWLIFIGCGLVALGIVLCVANLMRTYCCPPEKKPRSEDEGMNAIYPTKPNMTQFHREMFAAQRRLAMMEYMSIATPSTSIDSSISMWSPNRLGRPDLTRSRSSEFGVDSRNRRAMRRSNSFDESTLRFERPNQFSRSSEFGVDSRGRKPMRRMNSFDESTLRFERQNQLQRGLSSPDVAPSPGPAVGSTRPRFPGRSKSFCSSEPIAIGEELSRKNPKSRLPRRKSFDTSDQSQFDSTDSKSAEGTLKKRSKPRRHKSFDSPPAAMAPSESLSSSEDTKKKKKRLPRRAKSMDLSPPPASRTSPTDELSSSDQQASEDTKKKKRLPKRGKSMDFSFTSTSKAGSTAEVPSSERQASTTEDTKKKKRLPRRGKSEDFSCLHTSKPGSTETGSPKKRSLLRRTSSFDPSSNISFGRGQFGLSDDEEIVEMEGSDNNGQSKNRSGFYPGAGTRRGGRRQVQTRQSFSARNLATGWVEPSS